MIFHTKTVLQAIPQSVTVVAATKYFNPMEMKELFETGITHFGENRVEALLEKQPQLVDLPITWHYIGTLQTKKAKKIINQIDYLHSLDNLSLALEIEKRRETVLPCFIQVNISDEPNKHGLNVDEVIPFIQSLHGFTKIKVIGLMGMAELTKDESIIHHEFQKLETLQQAIKDTLQLQITELSIGMSNDYLIALEHHASYLRLGSILFDKEVA